MAKWRNSEKNATPFSPVHLLTRSPAHLPASGFFRIFTPCRQLNSLIDV
jgi:hypothetical protein